MKLIPENFKRLFGRRAASAVNDLAHWVNNFAYGFGIKVYREGAQANVAIDTESDALQAWIRETAGMPVKAGSGEQGTIVGPEDASSHPASNYEDTWKKGKYTADDGTETDDVGVIVPVVTGGALDATETSFFPIFRLLTFDRYGKLYSVSEEVYDYGS